MALPLSAVGHGSARGVLQNVTGRATTFMTDRYLGEGRKAQAAREMARYSPI